MTTSMTAESEAAQERLAAAATARPTQIAHIILRTRDRLQELAEYYSILLDAKPVNVGPNNIFLTFDDEHHRVGIFQYPNVAERLHNAPGLDHFAFTLPSVTALFARYEKAKAAGIVPFAPINHGVTTSMYFYDPDGNRVELQADNFDDVDAAITFVEAVDPSSIGVLYDADEVLAQLKAGVSEQDIIQQMKDGFGPTEREVIELISAPWIDPRTQA
jgi:catechol 2,3-dioxygenase-like lactoylglutathione lyase family enzyme